MPSASDLRDSIRHSPAGLTLAELLARHPGIARRTAQRWINKLVEDGQILARGEGRARRYLAVGPAAVAAPWVDTKSFPGYIPLSADSRDILSYVDQPLAARKPVGYQHEFLDGYRPNQTYYLPEPLRRQLHNMGDRRKAY